VRLVELGGPGVAAVAAGARDPRSGDQVDDTRLVDATDPVVQRVGDVHVAVRSEVEAARVLELRLDGQDFLGAVATLLVGAGDTTHRPDGAGRTAGVRRGVRRSRRGETRSCQECRHNEGGTAE